jgi:hypothetical protein
VVRSRSRKELQNFDGSVAGIVSFGSKGSGSETDVQHKLDLFIVGMAPEPELPDQHHNFFFLLFMASGVVFKPSP